MNKLKWEFEKDSEGLKKTRKGYYNETEVFTISADENEILDINTDKEATMKCRVDEICEEFRATEKELVIIAQFIISNKSSLERFFKYKKDENS